MNSENHTRPLRVLLYSPHLAGHRQVYCNVFTDILLEMGARVVLAAGFSGPQGLSEWKDIAHYQHHPHVEIINCADFSAQRNVLLTAEELLAMQQRYSIDATLIAEADLQEVELLRIALGQAPRLQGRNIGIFAWTSDWCPAEDPYSGAKIRRKVTVRQFFGLLKRRLLRRQIYDEHSRDFFFEEAIKSRRVLDIALVKDERVAQKKGHPYIWFPEIFKPFSLVETDADKAEYYTVSSAYQSFLSQIPGREVLLYFGKASGYRGYDYLIRLAQLDPEVSFVHCGEIFDTDDFEPDVQAVRRKLERQGRLFETCAYIHSERLVNLFFSSINRWVSSHRFTLSSGVMLQALAAGKPVLVPNTGLLGERVRKNKIGMTYRYADLADLYQQWQVFKKIPPASYTASIKTYMRQFQRDRIYHCLQHILQ